MYNINEEPYLEDRTGLMYFFAGFHLGQYFGGGKRGGGVGQDGGGGGVGQDGGGVLIGVECIPSGTCAQKYFLLGWETCPCLHNYRSLRELS